MSTERKKVIPYGRQTIDEDDVSAVVSVLKSTWLTTGPLVSAFEEKVANYVGAKFGAAVSSGTAGLHAAMYAANIGRGDEVIVPSLTFAATANSILYQGGTPIFADIEASSFLIDPKSVESKIGPRTKAIVAVDYAGNPCNYKELKKIAKQHKLILISDACHAIGGSYEGNKVGTLADMSVFSFHPVKHITTAEGGMVLTDSENFAKRIKLFRNHGITSDHRERESKGTCYYEMVDLGYNYRLSDLQCALGISQLSKLDEWIERRNKIAAQYNKAFSDIKHIRIPNIQPNSTHAYHLYVIELQLEYLKQSRDEILKELRGKNIFANVHYPPVHQHPYYRNLFESKAISLPNTEAAYPRLVSIPMYPTLTDQEVDFVVSAISGLALK